MQILNGWKLNIFSSHQTSYASEHNLQQARGTEHLKGDVQVAQSEDKSKQGPA
jgi:hypothetical protein